MWTAAFGMSKAEVVEYVSEDFRKYMVSAHFNMGSVKESLLESQSNDVVDPTSKVIQNPFKKIQQEIKWIRNYSLNTFYNFYSEGVLKRFVIKLT